jgi:hypothetical protein
MLPTRTVYLRGLWRVLMDLCLSAKRGGQGVGQGPLQNEVGSDPSPPEEPDPCAVSCAECGVTATREAQPPKRRARRQRTGRGRRRQRCASDRGDWSSAAWVSRNSRGRRGGPHRHARKQPARPLRGVALEAPRPRGLRWQHMPHCNIPNSGEIARTRGGGYFDRRSGFPDSAGDIDWWYVIAATQQGSYCDAAMSKVGPASQQAGLDQVRDVHAPGLLRWCRSPPMPA